MSLFKRIFAFLLMGGLVLTPVLILPVPSAKAVEMCPMMPGMTQAQMAAMGQQEPAEPPQNPPETAPVDPDNPDGNQPTHTQPTEYCTPHQQGSRPACGCTTDAIGRSGCKAGERETEVQHCMSFCWKMWCHCCRS
jgi:hypothetical protein